MATIPPLQIKLRLRARQDRPSFAAMGADHITGATVSVVFDASAPGVLEQVLNWRTHPLNRGCAGPDILLKIDGVVRNFTVKFAIQRIRETLNEKREATPKLEITNPTDPLSRAIELVDRIYENSFVPELWPGVLDELGRIVEGTGGALFISKATSILDRLAKGP